MSFPLAYKYQVTSHIRRVAAVDHFSLAYQSLSHSRQALLPHCHALPPAATRQRYLDESQVQRVGSETDKQTLWRLIGPETLAVYFVAKF